ncbi:helical backbone metal receptor [Sandaracinus amylolyticus]|uniref:helical backbone metal receptor n=1 Tax=Sandaracinus amylolyticus TaxID=927083 RepID=UPI001F355E88|nr:helical backbone metal receptor [Sandaracinus amylolyticus]UJR78743.1 ABC-type transporter, periplasmic subunit [Sandaracinus amylolyticus]
MVTVIDALGREVVVAREPRRVVSLVPSETESVVAMAGLERLVARTAYCEEPRGTIESIATIGGTKNVDVDAVCALAPDLVLANQEENSQRDVEALIARGVNVFVSFPCTVAAALVHLETTARLLHVEPSRVPEIDALRVALSRAEARITSRPVRVFAPIWKDPWMTFDGRTYASDLVRLAGGVNVFADRARRYPLAADLGRAEAKPTTRDTRYPRFELAEVDARAPERVLLPDEPYRFGETEKRELEAPGRRVELICGKDLFWYGVRAAGALERLAARLSS